MPTINGVTASIGTHDGPLEEFEVDEFPGGVSCFITAHSGRQFWLNYSIEKPISAQGFSVEFHVDGHRVDTQFPLATKGEGPPSVGPMKSSITSQYGKDDAGNVYRRDVFFTLLDKEKGKDIGSKNALGATGTIECKVYRAEKLGEWPGAITPESITPGSHGGSLKKRGISHTVRLGASMPANKTVRYTFRNLDPEDEPFAYFRFYYRSQKFMQRTRIAHWPSLSRPSSPVPRPISRTLTRKSSLYQSISRGKKYLEEKLSSTRPSEDNAGGNARLGAETTRPETAPPLSVSHVPAYIEEQLQRLEQALGMPENAPEKSEQIQAVRSKLEQLKQTPVVQMHDERRQEPEPSETIREETPSEHAVSPISDGKSLDIMGDSQSKQPESKQPDSKQPESKQPE
ncbi:hypothetical protein FPQ18DRAFT_125617 [Pyronema domesticum]|uniref:DUF7918 domain-containing protein n=1 Tax=Pyronema omphalodes (strain CBS 100304) TaxID=1076935 RepID=U4LAL5_PYROM|nr:hypothetical protein FPQ18DRAFT_125617 [Pyronema domesticum]CCX16156.1 Similar to hypothetical protein AOL_s00083g265 [Arthrobotrys oligospora ATCC 24927]; acc. no. EGX47757 [Pyronema omphalodes CBS 100304]